MALAHPLLQQEAREAIVCDYYIDAMDDPDFALKVRERAPATLDEALWVALQLQAWTKEARRNRSEDNQRLKPKVRGAVNADSSIQENLDNRFNRLEAHMSRRFDELVRFIQASGLAQRPKSSPPAARTEPAVNDMKPSKPDNVREGNSYGGTKPYRQPLIEPVRMARMQGSNRQAQFVCWRSGLPGNLQRNCGQPAQQPVKRPAGAVTSGSRGLDRDNVYLCMQLAGRWLPCLLDSGCELTLIPEGVAEPRY